jgi:hypothetical protein
MAKMFGERPPAEFESWDFNHGRRFEDVLERLGSSVHHPSSSPRGFFYHGRRFEDILERLGSSVHHPSSSPRGFFFRLAVFQRSSFCLSEESMGMALHSIIGGSPGGFHLECVKPCHFRFSVASKAVGFLIRALKRVTTRNFDVYFHLWRDGGANWQKELSNWEDKEEYQ